MTYSIEEMQTNNSSLGLNPSIPVTRETDVFIAGSGPIAATYALHLINAGYRVIMAEIGASDSFKAINVKDQAFEAMIPGYHKKNEVEYQKDIDRFVNVIQGALSTVSVPTNNAYVPDLDPSSFQNSREKPFISLGKNPYQNPFENLGAEAVTRGVGGMSTHWTCATPRFDRGLGRPILHADEAQDNKEWDHLYPAAEALIGTSIHEFDESIRHNLVLRTLQQEYAAEGRKFEPLPLACKRNEENPDYVEWSSAERMLRPIYLDAEKKKRFTLLTNHRVTRLALDTSAQGNHEVAAAEVRDLLEARSKADSYIKAKVFVVASGAIGGPQILWNSGFAGFNEKDQDQSLIPNLARYITEQPMTFCQIILNANLVNSVPSNPFDLPWWNEKVKRHQRKHPNDPIPMPFRDPEPQVTTRVTEKHPWHTQIHRDAFSYGAVAETIDTRLIVDFRFFGHAEPRARNRITFARDVRDAYGMPQPTFHFSLSEDDRKRNHDMMADMCQVASKLGGYLPGSEPRFLEPGLALHLAGTTRIGLKSDESVADTNSKVWKFKNLYVGGNGNIESGFAANPTLTSIALAVKASNALIKQLNEKKEH